MAVINFDGDFQHIFNDCVRTLPQTTDIQRETKTDPHI